jgi:hypothetical protein
MVKTDLISILTNLCDLLSSDPLTVNDVLPELVELPLDAVVEPKPGRDAPAFVRLTLPESSELTLETLQESFGSYIRLPRSHRLAPIEYTFLVDTAGTPFTCALIVEKEEGHSAVHAVTVRRDIRLD